MKPEEAKREAERHAVAILRARRHDFLNHLQVISGWLQLGRADLAASYVERTLRAMEEENSLIQAADPSLVVLLLAKEERAKARGIEMYPSIEPGLAALDEVAAALEPGLEAVIDRVIDHSPRAGGEVRVSLGGTSDQCYLAFDEPESGGTWLVGALTGAPPEEFAAVHGRCVPCIAAEPAADPGVNPAANPAIGRRWRVTWSLDARAGRRDGAS